MTILGAGQIGAGTGPAGLWDDDSELEPLPAPSHLSLYLDPATRSPVYDPTTGQLQQMDGTRQRVLLCLVTILGSSNTYLDWGVRKPAKHTASFAAEREASVKDALRHMTDVERAIRIESVTTEVGGSRSRTTVRYTNLVTEEQEEVAI